MGGESYKGLGRLQFYLEIDNKSKIQKLWYKRQALSKNSFNFRKKLNGQDA